MSWTWCNYYHGDYSVYFKELFANLILTGAQIIYLEVFVKSKQSLYRSGETLRSPGSLGPHISRQSAHEGGKFVSLTLRPPLSPSKYSWYLFLLQAESIPGSQCDRKDYVIEKFQWHHRESNPRSSSALPQPTALRCAPRIFVIVSKYRRILIRHLKKNEVKIPFHPTSSDFRNNINKVPRLSPVYLSAKNNF